ncbi:MAG: DUF1573 domain-containing protein [Planctomycetales bacterium]|nr:DUF1573 domain-containing protein [Planctomycetales bacterium]MCA9203831.1 DUF1573 domain-containing protein [Planctomycetales bacterium]
MLHRMICCSAVGLFLLAAPVSGQEWAKKMFEVTSHDFGTVARGAKSEYEFVFSNIYKEDIHIASVRTSCGCTTPTVTKSLLKTYEKAAVRAKFNTDSFQGNRSATITVTIDKPYFAEVQLNVHGYIRGDVVFEPGTVNLGEIEQGKAGQSQTTVSFFGRSDWKIVDVRSANDNFEVELDERERSGAAVRYTMLVRLKDTAPPGFINDQLTLVTDDSTLRTIPLPVEGHVVPALTVSPAALHLGVLQPGETVTKKLVVRAKQPFSVTNVDCGGDCFQFEKPAGEKNLHFVSVTFTAGESPGKVSETIRITTDRGFAATCLATATIEPTVSATTGAE